MAGDRQEHVAHVTIETVTEQTPPNMKKPGGERSEQGVESGQQQVLGAGPLPFDRSLQAGYRETGHHRHHDRHQPGPWTGGLGGNKDSARRHGSAIQFDLAMGTFKV